MSYGQDGLNNDPNFDLPSVGDDSDGEVRYCSSEACDNELLPWEDDGALCGWCQAEYDKQVAYYGALYASERGRLSKSEVLDGYSHPTEAAKRERMERDYEGRQPPEERLDG